jgi:rod shape-determining protein MreC
MRGPLNVHLGSAPPPAWWQRDLVVVCAVALVLASVVVLGGKRPPERRDVGDRARQNEALRRQVAELRYEQHLMEERLREGERLRALQELSGEINRRGFPFCPAPVVEASIADSRITLGRGTVRSGVGPRDVVVAPKGLVGRVVEAGTFTSEAALLTDPRIGVPARVVSAGPGHEVVSEAAPDADTSDGGEEASAGLAAVSGVRGVVTGGRADGLLVLGYLTADEPINVGDEVVTSGGGRIYPPGIPIGTVLAEPRKRVGVPLEVLVRPHVEWRTLYEVLLLHVDDE